ncbi:MULTISPECIES: DUF6114 domain-containing protein [unclassified Streptomyces]|uniref:DUF6114 domain-containing protein n=1 Tax=unclassified Streptomyces TaxID=2593676 RepID=UPI001661BAC4|nr:MULTISPECIES: DUF6114 domain-containing protein [unclassified Streptomyces]MBD0843187.1 hypothetical protein [Streptomyces sp. TRM68416]
MSAETPAVPGRDEHYLRVVRRRFRAWRGERPFWAGLFVMLGGLPIAYFPYANLQIGHLTLAMATTAGAGSLIIGVLLVVLGVSLWFQKHVRTFAGVAAILLALVSIPVSNIGGFLIGFLFALVGGAMAVAWAPGAPPQPQPVQGGTAGEGDAPEGVVPAAPVTTFEKSDAPFEKSDAPEGGIPAPRDGVDEPKDLSGTSPVNGANGRHSAG